MYLHKPKRFRLVLTLAIALASVCVSACIYPAGSFDFSAATPVQLDEYQGLLIDERVRRAEVLEYLRLMHGGAELYIQGQRDLGKIRQAEESAAQAAH
jgi:hypothetical protein